MNYQYNIHQGTYKLQTGFKSTTALIECPYLTQKVQVQNAHLLKILDSSEVYWAETRRFVVNRKNSTKQQTIIQAAILGVKYSPYIYQGKNVLSSISCSQFVSGNPSNLYARPISDKLPIIRILNTDCSDFLIDSAWSSNKLDFYYWVRIIDWNPDEQYPTGVLVSKFKKAKTAQSEAQAVLYSMEIDQSEYQQSSLIKNPTLTSQIQLPILNHTTFEETIFSIDPKDCDDMEDAFSLVTVDSVKKIYEVGVHIADVSSFMDFVDRNTICHRGCTIYLPHKKISLFPNNISDLSCFKEKQKRLAVSVFMTMNQLGQILETRFEKTVIRNAAAMAYKEAEQILLKKNNLDSKVKQLRKKHKLKLQEAQKIVKNLHILRKIAAERRKIRKGQQILDRDQVTFQLDKNKMPIDIGFRKRYESQRLVEEFMIACNGQVAKKLVSEYGRNSLVISHPRPTQYSINNFNSFLSDYGIKFNSDNIESFQKQMKKLFEKEEIKEQVKEMLLMRAVQMQELATYTKYINSQKGHYGLQMEYYTHFTSPLRRFADVIVHEQLKSCVFGEKEKPKSISLASEIQILNKIRAKSKKLKHRIVQCFLNLLLHEKKTKIAAKGLVMSLGKKSATLYIPLYNLVKQVPWRGRVQIHSKDCVDIKCLSSSQNEWKSIHKNDSVDIELEVGCHQQVFVSVVLETEPA